jgi:dTDP-6-deoxy-L-talose 4-dehydrogenase (NAD+)
MTNSKAVLITGGGGFVGVNVARILADDNTLDLTFVTRNPESIRKRLGERAHRVVTFDILDEQTWQRIDFSRYGRVLHMAWDHLDDFNHPDHMNVLLPCHFAFLRKLLAEGAQSITVTGTCLEYGLQIGPLREDLPTEPVTLYGVAKDALRKVLELTCTQHHSRLQWIRLFYLHGPGQQKKALLSQLDAALDRGDDHFDMSAGDQKRDYLSTLEAGERIARIFQNEDFAGIVNCCSGEPISVRSLVEKHLAERDAQLELRLGKFPYPEYEPFAFWGDTMRLSRVLEGGAL